jgi:hypothetical protein
MNIKNGCIGLLVLFITLFSINASALPAFARKNNVKCSSCHIAFPGLSAMGQRFKEDGYRFTGSTAGDAELSDKLQFDKNFPMSLALIARPYTDSKSGDTEIRAIHEAEIYAAGEIYKNISGMMEVESEGEDGFGLVLSSAHITYNHNQSVNVQTGYGPTMMADPYDTYADMRRQTASHFELLNQTFGDTDNGDKLRHSRQQFSVYGRPMGNLFYNVGMGGLTGDLVGSDSSVVFGRVAVDVAPGMMVGGLILNGSCRVSDCTASTSGTRNFSRTAIDGQFDVGAFRFTGVYMQAKDDTDAGGDVSNNSYYVQGFYRFMENGRPTLVPLVRLENFETNDGADEYALATVNLTYYLDENVKGFIEYRSTYDTPSGVDTDNETTMQVEIVF